MKIFYSWQSDLPTKTTKNFIQSSIQKAIKELVGEQDNPFIDFDRDTLGITGSPSIVATILNKINKDTDIFIADLSYAHTLNKEDELDTESEEYDPNIENYKKGMPNPNVLIEYGFALRSIGDRRIISVINETYGPSKDIPFDLKDRRWPISFKLSEDDNEETRQRIKKKLIQDLKNAIKPILSMGPAYRSKFVEDITKTNNPIYPQNFKKLVTVLNFEEVDIQEYKYIKLYKALIEKMRELPPACLSFLKLCLERSSKDNAAVQTAEIERCFGVFNHEQIMDIFCICQSKGLVCLGEIDVNEYIRNAFVLCSFSLHPWNIWLEIRDFAHKTKQNLSVFIEDLDFSSMDE